MMGQINKVGDASDREAWLELRKSYLTASAIYGWRGPAFANPKNKWFFADNNREAILAEKFDGVEKEFGAYNVVSMAHGANDEENIIRKVGEELGCYVEPDNSMFVNDRWPHIAATVDAYIYRPTTEPALKYCQDSDQSCAVVERLKELEGVGTEATILEIKKSVSVGWARQEVPEYYIAQVQTQLHVLDLPFGVIAAECLFKHPKEKWRMFWDLRPTIVVRDPAWAEALDVANLEFSVELDNHATA